MGPWLVLVSPCLRENIVATCKIGSFLCSLDNLLQENVIVSFLEIKFQNDGGGCCICDMYCMTLFMWWKVICELCTLMVVAKLFIVWYLHGFYISYNTTVVRLINRRDIQSTNQPTNQPTNGAHLKKKKKFSHFLVTREKLQKKFLQHISHSHTYAYFAHPIEFFCLTNFEKNTNLSDTVSLWCESCCWFLFAPFWNNQ